MNKPPGLKNFLEGSAEAPLLSATEVLPVLLPISPQQVTDRVAPTDCLFLETFPILFVVANGTIPVRSSPQITFWEFKSVTPARLLEVCRHP
jgi:hypothetical protein